MYVHAEVRAQGNSAIVLMRPRADVPLYVTLVVTVVVVYWLIWIGQQSHYPVTTSATSGRACKCRTAPS